MTAAPEIVEVSIATLVLGLGMRGIGRNLSALSGRPVLLLRILVAREILIPLLVMSVLALFGVDPHVRLGAALLTISPASPHLSRRRNLGEDPRSALTLAASTAGALLSVLVIPCWLALVSEMLMENTTIEATAVTRLVTVLFVLPLVLGVAARRCAPDLMTRASGGVFVASRLLLVVALVAMTASALPTVHQLGPSFVVLIVAISAASLGIGRLAAVGTSDRSAIALTCATRHPGLALLVAQGNFAGDPVLAAVVVSFIVGGVVTSVYGFLTRHRREALGIAVVPRLTR